MEIWLLLRISPQNFDPQQYLSTKQWCPKVAMELHHQGVHERFPAQAGTIISDNNQALSLSPQESIPTGMGSPWEIQQQFFCCGLGHTEPGWGGRVVFCSAKSHFLVAKSSLQTDTCTKQTWKFRLGWDGDFLFTTCFAATPHWLYFVISNLLLEYQRWHIFYKSRAKEPLFIQIND